MGFFDQQQAMQPPPQMGGGGIPPELQAMLAQIMQQRGGQPPMGVAPMPPGGMNPTNVPQQGLMPEQMPLAGPGPSDQMNPLASIIGNQGGPMMPQGQMNGTGGGGNGMGGLEQIINALKSNQQTNGVDPQQAPGGMNIMALIQAMKGGQ